MATYSANTTIKILTNLNITHATSVSLTPAANTFVEISGIIGDNTTAYTITLGGVNYANGTFSLGAPFTALNGVKIGPGTTLVVGGTNPRIVGTVFSNTP